MNSMAHPIPPVDTTPTGRLPHAVLNPDAPAFVNGKPTPEAERAFDRFTDWMIAEANKTPEPGVTLARICAALPEAMAEAWAEVQARRTNTVTA
ncbi:hypothetical protein [Streptomyces sp. 1222.5]|uniref:hypothetical protein n=1 Tax=Streptomyces sp. 1222.5 TaxID=1881026 RepID=UPI003D7272E3